MPRSGGWLSVALLVLVVLSGSTPPARADEQRRPPDPTRAGAPTKDVADKSPEMAEARRLLQDAVAAQKAGNAKETERLQLAALEQLEFAWERHKDPDALFRAALMYAGMLDRPVTAAQAALRYLGWVHYQKIDVTSEAGVKRTQRALELVAAGYASIRDAKVDPDQRDWCGLGARRPTKGLLRLDDPINQKFLIVREDGTGRVFISNCDATQVVDPTPVEPPPPVDDRVSGGWVLFWSGVGVAAGVGGGLMGWAYIVSAKADGLQLRDDGYFDHEEHARGLLWGGVTAAGVGVAMMTGGLVWALTDDESSEGEGSSAVTPRLGLGHVGIEVTF